MIRPIIVVFVNPNADDFLFNKIGSMMDSAKTIKQIDELFYFDVNDSLKKMILGNAPQCHSRKSFA